MNVIQKKLKGQIDWEKSILCTLLASIVGNSADDLGITFSPSQLLWEFLYSTVNLILVANSWINVGANEIITSTLKCSQVE